MKNINEKWSANILRKNILRKNIQNKFKQNGGSITCDTMSFTQYGLWKNTEKMHSKNIISWLDFISANVDDFDPNQTNFLQNYPMSPILNLKYDSGNWLNPLFIYKLGCKYDVCLNKNGKTKGNKKKDDNDLPCNSPCGTSSGIMCRANNCCHIKNSKTKTKILYCEKCKDEKSSGFFINIIEIIRQYAVLMCVTNSILTLKNIKDQSNYPILLFNPMTQRPFSPHILRIIKKQFETGVKTITTQLEKTYVDRGAYYLKLASNIWIVPTVATLLADYKITTIPASVVPILDWVSTAAGILILGKASLHFISFYSKNGTIKNKQIWKDTIADLIGTLSFGVDVGITENIGYAAAKTGQGLQAYSGLSIFIKLLKNVLLKNVEQRDGDTFSVELNNEICKIHQKRKTRLPLLANKEFNTLNIKLNALCPLEKLEKIIVAMRGVTRAKSKFLKLINKEPQIGGGLNMYKYIINPITNKKVNVCGKIGMRILKKYLHQ